MRNVVYTATWCDTVRVVVHRYNTGSGAAMGYVRADEEEAAKLTAACSLLTPQWSISSCAVYVFSIDEFLAVIGAKE